jgi:hypothetical protein
LNHVKSFASNKRSFNPLIVSIIQSSRHSTYFFIVYYVTSRPISTTTLWYSLISDKTDVNSCSHVK